MEGVRKVSSPFATLDRNHHCMEMQPFVGHLLSGLHGLQIHRAIAGRQTLESGGEIPDRLHQPAVQMQLHPAWPLLLHPLQMEQQSVLLAVGQHQVVEGYRAHPLVSTLIAQHSFEGRDQGEVEVMGAKRKITVKRGRLHGASAVKIWFKLRLQQ